MHAFFYRTLIDMVSTYTKVTTFDRSAKVDIVYSINEEDHVYTLLRSCCYIAIAAVIAAVDSIWMSARADYIEGYTMVPASASAKKNMIQTLNAELY